MAWMWVGSGGLSVGWGMCGCCSGVRCTWTYRWAGVGCTGKSTSGRCVGMGMMKAQSRSVMKSVCMK